MSLGALGGLGLVVFVELAVDVFCAVVGFISESLLVAMYSTLR